MVTLSSLIHLCIHYVDSCCINLDNWSIVQQYNKNNIAWFFLVSRCRRKRGRGDTSRSQSKKTTALRFQDKKTATPKSKTKTPLHRETETIKSRHRDSKVFFQRTKSHDIEIPRLKNHDIEIPRPWTTVLQLLTLPRHLVSTFNSRPMTITS